MASEDAVPAADLCEAVAARAMELVRALLKPGGDQSVEPSADAMAEEEKWFAALIARVNPDVRLEDVDTLAVAAAVGALVGDVHLRGRSLNAPNSMMEEAVTYAVAEAAGFLECFLAGARTTSPAHGSAFPYLIAAFAMVVAILTMLVVRIVCY